MTRTAWIAGATGMVGSHLVNALLEDTTFERVVTVGRRPIQTSHSKLSQVTVDFSNLQSNTLPEATDAFCTLGTTIKKAGSEEAFRAVDFDAVLQVARAARDRGVQNFYVVTALGADQKSMSFYNRVKGEIEEALRALQFQSLSIVRPSLLLGERSESRPGERVAIVLSKALAPLLKPFGSRPIEGSTVALALRSIAKNPVVGTRVYLSGELHGLAKHV
jgi:uncharacterized protein YbjT (DUF2867 family)